MKFCTSCGAQMEDNAAFCTSCGTAAGSPVTSNSAVHTPTPTYTYVNRNITFKEYLETQADPAHLKTIKTSAIVCYICLAISLIFAILFNYAGLIDVVILGALTLGMHLGKSKVCAIILLIYSIISTLIAFASTGSFTGYLWILASILAVVSYSKLTKAYKAFQTGQ